MSYHCHYLSNFWFLKGNWIIIFYPKNNGIFWSGFFYWDSYRKLLAHTAPPRIFSPAATYLNELHLDMFLLKWLKHQVAIRFVKMNKLCLVGILCMFSFWLLRSSVLKHKYMDTMFTLWFEWHTVILWHHSRILEVSLLHVKQNFSATDRTTNHSVVDTAERHE